MGDASDIALERFDVEVTLKIVSDYINVPDPVVLADKPCWLWAETINVDGVTALYVFRSPLVKDDHPYYSDVADLVVRYETVDRVAWQTILDPSMMFGRLVWAVDLLYNGTLPDSGKVKTLIRLVSSFYDLDVKPHEVPGLVREWFVNDREQEEGMLV